MDAGRGGADFRRRRSTLWRVVGASGGSLGVGGWFDCGVFAIARESSRGGGGLGGGRIRRGKRSTRGPGQRHRKRRSAARGRPPRRPGHASSTVATRCPWRAKAYTNLRLAACAADQSGDHLAAFQSCHSACKSFRKKPRPPPRRVATGRSVGVGYWCEGRRRIDERRRRCGDESSGRDHDHLAASSARSARGVR